MRFAAILTAFAGLAVAGGTVYLSRDYISVQPSEPEPVAGTVSVIIANRDIAFGETISPNMLATVAWPQANVPEAVYTNFDDLLPASGQEPRRARRLITRGDTLREWAVSGYGEKVTIVQTLAPNARAMAIKVSAETAVGGFVTPGDRVDVVLTQGRGQNLSAVTILQNIRVIGVDQDADEQSDAPGVARTVTVEVTADQGQRLAVAQNAGKLSLTLRSFDDDTALDLDTTRLSDVLYQSQPSEIEKPRPVIRVRRGNDVTVTPLN